MNNAKSTPVGFGIIGILIILGTFLFSALASNDGYESLEMIDAVREYQITHDEANTVKTLAEAENLIDIANSKNINSKGDLLFVVLIVILLLVVIFFGVVFLVSGRRY